MNVMDKTQAAGVARLVVEALATGSASTREMCRITDHLVAVTGWAIDSGHLCVAVDEQVDLDLLRSGAKAPEDFRHYPLLDAGDLDDWLDDDVNAYVGLALLHPAVVKAVA